MEGTLSFCILRIIVLFVPSCGSSKINIKDHSVVHITHSIIQVANITLYIDKHRYVCKDCGKTFTQSISFISKRNSISNTTKQIILEKLKDNISFSKVAKELNVSIQTVINVFDDNVKVSRNTLPNILCIDEFYFKVAKGIKYPCVITGFHPFKIIDVIRSRQMSQLTHYFGNIMPSERNRVKYFVSDMNDTYREIKALFFPNSIHIIDTFHVVLLFTNALNMIRKRIMKKYNVKSYEYYFLKTNWKSILMNSNKLSKKEKVDSKTGEVYTFKERFFNDLMIFPELYEAYMIKDDFLYYEKKSEVKKVMNMIRVFVERCKNASSEEMRKCGESLNKWSNEIANGFIKNEYNLNITNAKAERMNRTIGDILRNAFGYKSFDRLRKRVLYIEREKSKK